MDDPKDGFTNQYFLGLEILENQIHLYFSIFNPWHYNIGKLKRVGKSDFCFWRVAAILQDIF